MKKYININIIIIITNNLGVNYRTCAELYELLWGDTLTHWNTVYSLCVSVSSQLELSDW